MLQDRTRDLVYLVFLLIHIPATLLVDVQALWFAPKVSPRLLRQIFAFAAKDDPLLSSCLSPHFVWFQSFIFLEIVFQLPVFFLGARGLWLGRKSIYPLLAVYGASSATTTFACLATVLAMNGPEIERQRPMLLASYGPFFLIPLAMAVDYTRRLTRMITEREGKEKRL